MCIDWGKPNSNKKQKNLAVNQSFRYVLKLNYY